MQRLAPSADSRRWRQHGKRRRQGAPPPVLDRDLMLDRDLPLGEPAGATTRHCAFGPLRPRCFSAHKYRFLRITPIFMAVEQGCRWPASCAATHRLRRHCCRAGRALPCLPDFEGCAPCPVAGDELLAFVLAKLSPADLGAAEGVCRRWRTLAAQHSLWRRHAAEAGAQEQRHDGAGDKQRFLEMQVCVRACMHAVIGRTA